MQSNTYPVVVKIKQRHFCLIGIDRMSESLGSGQFGQVSKGIWQSPVGEIPVAVKTLKEGKEADDDEVRFLQEAAINGQFQHRNVVKLHGVVTLAKPVSKQLNHMHHEKVALKVQCPMRCSLEKKLLGLEGG